MKHGRRWRARGFWASHLRRWPALPYRRWNHGRDRRGFGFSAVVRWPARLLAGDGGAVEILEEAERFRIYERVPEGKPYGSLDAMLRAEIGVTAEESKQDVSNRQQAAQQAAQDNPTPQPTNSEAKKGNQNARKTTVPKSKNGTVVSHGSNQASTRIRRLRRDNPEAAERLARGEFKSVAAAERWAGGEEPHPAYPKKTALMWLQHWWNKADSETRQEFLDWVGNQNGGEI